MNVKPKPKHNKEQKPNITTSSPACTKPHVVRRLESCMSKFGEAHNMLARTKLSKEDYQPISTLLASAKVELFNIYYELKNNQL